MSVHGGEDSRAERIHQGAQRRPYRRQGRPGLGDEVLGLYPLEIHGFGWAIAAIGAFSCLVVCEAYKCYSNWMEVTKGSSGEMAGYEEDESGEVVVHTDTDADAAADAAKPDGVSVELKETAPAPASVGSVEPEAAPAPAEEAAPEEAAPKEAAE